MIDTDEVQKVRDLAVELGFLKESENLYSLTKRLTKQFGEEVVVDGLNFFLEKMLANKFYGELIPSLVGFCSKANQELSLGETVYKYTPIPWVQPLDITGLSELIQNLKVKHASVEPITSNLTDKGLVNEIFFLKIIRAEWETLLKIKKVRSHRGKQNLWRAHQKSISNAPFQLLLAKHKLLLKTINDKYNDTNSS